MRGRVGSERESETHRETRREKDIMKIQAYTKIDKGESTSVKDISRKNNLTAFQFELEIPFDLQQGAT